MVGIISQNFGQTPPLKTFILKIVSKVSDLHLKKSHYSYSLEGIGVTDSRCHNSELRIGVTDSRCHNPKLRIGVTDSRCYNPKLRIGVTDSRWHNPKLRIGAKDSRCHNSELGIGANKLSSNKMSLYTLIYNII